jgi:hypothetical protein
MNLIDWILNLAGLFLWVDWRSGRVARHHSVISLASALRETEARTGRGWASLAILAVILLVRPLFYSTVGGAVAWTPHIDLLAISLPWRSDLVERMYLYSIISFAIMLGWFYACLLLTSAVNRSTSEGEVMQRFVRLQLGWLEKLPWWLKLFLPTIAVILCWAALAPVFAWLGLLPLFSDAKRLWGQALALGLAAVLSWKWFLIALFLVHLLNLYVYLGTHPAWAYISGTAEKILKPVAFVRIGRLNLSPVVGIAVVLLISDFVMRPAVNQLFEKYIA